jgi:hypothetical protein
MASGSVRWPSRVRPRQAGGPESAPSRDQMAFSTTSLSSRAASPCTCSASTGRPSPSRASLRWMAVPGPPAVPSGTTPSRSGCLIVGRSSSSAESGVPAGTARPVSGANRMTMSANAR